MVRLSANPAISIIERDDLGKALGEVELKELLGDRKKRSRFGEIAGADFLALLNVTGNRARLVVCDTKLGVTLQDQSIGISDLPQKEALEILAKTTLQTLESFAGGVKQVVAVSDFVCRDLTFDFTYLQSDYAEVLRSAYRQIPGLAIVATEEAKTIAVERDIAGLAQKDRIVSVFIEGEYRTTRDLKTNRFSVDIMVRARDSTTVLIDKTLPTSALIQAGSELMAFFRKDLAKLATPSDAKIDEEAQYKLLMERADVFSALGELKNSTSLLEAALLLKPDDKLRIRLIREYHRQASNNKDMDPHAWPEGTKLNESNPQWVAEVTRMLNDWRRSLQHGEYLVLNRRLSREEACDLLHDSTCSKPMGVHYMKSPPFDHMDVSRDFLRHIFARVAHLEPASQEVRSRLLGHVIFLENFFGIVPYNTKEDLDLIKDLLLDILPRTLPPSSVLCSNLESCIHRFRGEGKSSSNITKEEFHAFLDQLIASNHPTARAYGRYWNIKLMQLQREPAVKLLKESELMMKDAESVSYDPYYYPSGLGPMGGVTRDLKRMVENENIRMTPKPLPAKTSDKTETDLISRISLERINLQLTNTEKKGQVITASLKWNYDSPPEGGGGWFGVNRFRPLGDKLDAIWAPGAVLFLHKQNEATVVLSDKTMRVADVVTDGRYVWVAGYSGWGLAVLDREGKILTRIGKEHGLPPNNSYGIVVHPLEPGRVMVAGCFSKINRAWIAMVTYDGSKASVEVIHEATQSSLPENANSLFHMDPYMTFVPEMSYEHVIPGEKPKRLVFLIKRAASSPSLVIDPDANKVWVYPTTEKNRKWLPAGKGNLSIDGTLWVPGTGLDFCSYRYNEATKLFDVVRDKQSEFSGSNSGSLARDGDWLYYVGIDVWSRFNLLTEKKEILNEDIRALPHFGSGRNWQVYRSAHHGLVAFLEGELYRIEVKP